MRVLHDRECNFDLELLHEEMLNIALLFDSFCEEHGLNYMVCGGSLLGAVRHKGFIPWDDDFDVAMPRTDFLKFLDLWRDSDSYALIKIGDPGYYKQVPAKIFLKGTRVSEINEENNGMQEFNPYGIFLDIFVLDEYPDNFIGHVINKYVGKLMLAKVMSNFHQKNRPLLVRTCIKLFRIIPVSVLNWVVRTSLHYITKSYKGECNTFIGYGAEIPIADLTLAPNHIFPLKRKCKINGHYFFGPSAPDEYLSHRFGDYWKLPPLNERKRHILRIKYETDQSE